MRTHRYRKLLCCKSNQQEDDGWEGAYGALIPTEELPGDVAHIRRLTRDQSGPQRDSCSQKSINGPPEHSHASRLLRDDEQP